MNVSVRGQTGGIARAVDIDGDSDYGSDFSAGEEVLVGEILADLTSGHDSVATAATTAEQSTHGQSRPQSQSRAQSAAVPATRLARALSSGSSGGDDGENTSAWRLEHGAVSVDSVWYPDLSRALSDLQAETDAQGPAKSKVEPEPERVSELVSKSPPETKKKAKKKVEKVEKVEKIEKVEEEDTRSPLQRFRSYPRRPLTVTDMAAGAWCELQHWYTLTRLPGGRRTVTPAMRGGSRVHQTLEDEVHTTVEVTITSREEAFALRLWSLIQGLRTLRDTGITRELEVWGVVEGELFNGVIDQLNYKCPDSLFEEELGLARRPASASASEQQSITDFMSPLHKEKTHKTVYLTDVKTRGSDRIPSGVALRPARVQLFLYHRLLCDMAADKLDYTAVFERYGLDGEVRFSDAFMAQIGSLHDEIFFDADSVVDEISSEPSFGSDFTELIGYRSINQIVPLLKAELAKTFPRGPNSIGDLLYVQYRQRSDGHIIGGNSFPNDRAALDGYMKDQVQWWRGEREPRGVTIEETNKCGWCEFAETCQWRMSKEAELLKKKKRKR
ncbi:hypothetical protein F4777DRAFT_105378 [Nemania sp. FL0916]|nr:hypothetical protein F4777DRAFT_105378 [Nemania sp. FL0916]